MKHKRTAALLAAVILLLCAFPIVSAKTDSFSYGRGLLAARPQGSRLTAAYDAIEAVVAEAGDKAEMLPAGIRLNRDELTDVYYMVFADHPEFFWMTNGFFYTKFEDGTVEAIEPTYNALKEERTAYSRQLEEAVTLFLSGTEGKSDYEKSLLLHDRLCLHTDYVFTDNDQNVYGALVEKKAVCAGYSRAYQLLLHRAGLPCFYVMGSVFESKPEEAESHAWNMSAIDGEWYYTDVTWDDNGSTEQQIYREYLNIPYSDLIKQHAFFEGIYQDTALKTTATAANYFHKSSKILEKPNIDTLARLLKDGSGRADFLLCEGTAEDFFRWFKQNEAAVLAKAGFPAAGMVSGEEHLFREIHLFVKKAAGHRLTGPVSLPMQAAVGDTVTAQIAAPPDARLYWTWYRDGERIPAFNSGSYTVTEADAGKTLSAWVMADNYLGALQSSACPVERPAWLPGDMNADGRLDSDDAVYLLYHLHFNEQNGTYPIPAYIPLDVNGDGREDSDDAVYLLYHVSFYEQNGTYPLYPAA